MPAATPVVVQPREVAMPAAVQEAEDAPEDKSTVEFLRGCLLDPGMPVALRWRAIMTLRDRKGAGPRLALTAAMADASPLLAHEAAFSLGQMQDPESIPGLRATLTGIQDFHPIVRHEAAEALGAIGTPECLGLLQDALVNDPAPEVRETCELALHRIKNVQADDPKDSHFQTVDAAVASSPSCSVSEMRKKILDEKAQLHERYVALFGLRNRGCPDSVAAVIASLKCESALLKHEVAYVLGQLQDKASTDALVGVLEDVSEHPMARHEAAEALGRIADQRSVDVLKVFSSDPEPIVAQSCEVALHLLELEQQGKTFELTLDTAA